MSKIAGSRSFSHSTDPWIRIRTKMSRIRNPSRNTKVQGNKSVFHTGLARHQGVALARSHSWLGRSHLSHRLRRLQNYQRLGLHFFSLFLSELWDKIAASLSYIDGTCKDWQYLLPRDKTMSSSPEPDLIGFDTPDVEEVAERSKGWKWRHRYTSKPLF
jgi:hypothetical protein